MSEIENGDAVYSEGIDNQVGNDPLQREIHQAGTDDKQVQTMSLTALDNTPEPGRMPVPSTLQPGRLPLEAMFDVPITLIFEVGRTDITIKQLMELEEGSFVPLRHISVDSVDVRVNDDVIAQAQTINMQQRYGIRFGEVEMISTLEDSNENI